MLPKFISKSISNKIVFALILLVSISSLFIIANTVWKVRNDNIQATKQSLNMLNDAIFQSLRNAMNTGDVEQIKKAEHDASTIKGVNQLHVAKSKALIELYATNDKFTNDPEIIKAFQTKTENLIETKTDDSHNLRMIKPMIATNECLSCHSNQAIGDVVGVIDLTFSLDEADNSLFSLLVNIFVTSTVLGWLTIGIIFYIIRKITNPINDLTAGFKDLIQSNDSTLKLNVNSEDEIGEAAKLFNNYMEKIHEGLAQDKKVIEEASDVLEKTANGFFAYQVSSSASNPYVEELKSKLNEMIKQTKLTLEKLNLTIKHFSESKFDSDLDDADVFGDLRNVTSGIKLVGNNTSEILAMIMNTGEALKNQTHTLSNASSNLSTASNTQAASLEETAAALEEITENIRGNTENTAKMAKLAQGVTVAANDGQKLAYDTAKAMDQINEKTSLIYESIDAIYQIAFQTNILSLNAAVEAATAGEAGKGFAVVAGEVRNLATRSAEAAKIIKELVESASSTASDGKAIADNMIKGYDSLNTSIGNTITLINDVAFASKEQEKGIIQINDAVNSLDKATQQNAHVADEIAEMSKQIAELSQSLVTAASRARYIQEARNEVCDIDLVYDTAEVKVSLLEIKDAIFDDIGTYKILEIAKNPKFDIWLSSFKSNYPRHSASADNIYRLNEIFRNKLEMLIKANANKEPNSTLNEISKDLENSTNAIFDALNKLKSDVCRGA